LDELVVAADPGCCSAAAISDTAHRTKTKAPNRRGLRPSAATSLALQIPSRHVGRRPARHLPPNS
jgi:hypothetical protein